jgi:hypothetical protein
MANKTRNIGKGSRSETEIAQIVSDKLRSRKDRDALTRAVGAIKVTDTQARQWNRWSV